MVNCICNQFSASMNLGSFFEKKKLNLFHQKCFKMLWQLTINYLQKPQQALFWLFSVVNISTR